MNTPKYNDISFKDSFIEKEKNRKKSDAKTTGQYGPKYVRNPDKTIITTKGKEMTKEEYVRSGTRKKEKTAHRLAALGAAGFTAKEIIKKLKQK